MADVEFTIGAIDKASSAINGVRGAILTLNQAMQLAGQVYQAVTNIIKQTVGEYVKYAEQVRNISQLTKQSSEDTSRLIQVTEDYKIQVSDLTTASRKLATEGLSLNVKTIAELSDEFLKLNTGAERQAFLTKNLGRASAEWTGILMQGSKAILAQSDAVEKGLILTDAATRSARQYEIALDKNADQVMALKIAIGQYLLPVLMQVNDFLINKSLPGWGEFFKTLGYYANVLKQGWSNLGIDWFEASGLKDIKEILPPVIDYVEELGKQIEMIDWEQNYTGIETMSDRVKSSTDLMSGWLKDLGSEGADIWNAYLVSTEAISPAAIEQFVKIQAAFIQVRNWLESGMSIPIIVNFLTYTLTGSGPQTGTSQPAVGGGGTKTLASWASAADIAYANAHPDIYAPTGRASGGYVSGRYAITGDSMSGQRTGYEELVDFQQKRVYSAPETQAMGAIPRYAMGSGAIDLSYQTIQDLANAVAQKMSGYV
jgi:hypothetical protein